MAVDLADHAGALRRTITPLGSNLFSAVTDAQLAQYLTDAFWEAKLDGFLEEYTVDEDGIIEEQGGIEFPVQNVALLVLYAGVRIMSTQILNTNTGFRAKAGPVEFEQSNSALMLAEMLRQLSKTKERVIAEAQYGTTDVIVLDGFSQRLFTPGLYGGAPELAG